MSSNKRNKPSGDRQADLFAPHITDLRLRDQQETMEHAFLSLSKRPRTEPIEYRNADGSAWVKVDPHQNYGMANIYDWDVIIWVASQIRAAMDRGEDPPRTIGFRPYNLLKSIRRGHGKTEYELLRKSFERLTSTFVKTNIRRPDGREQEKSFTWLDEWEELRNDKGEATSWKLTLCQWLWEGIIDERLILSVHEDYFLLTGGTERWLYRVARKHAGRQTSGYSFQMRRLYVKSGSTGTKRKFAYRLRKIVRRDELPEYCLELREDEGGGERVWMCRRSLLPEDDPRHEPASWSEQKHLSAGN